MRNNAYFERRSRAVGLQQMLISSESEVAAVDAGGPYPTNNGDAVSLAGATADGVDSVLWTTSGNGTFSPNATTLHASYTPGSADRTAGAGQNVVLTLHGIVGGSDVVQDTAACPVTISGTDTRRVEADAKNFGGSSWDDADAGLIFASAGGKNSRVRFFRHESGTIAPSGSTIDSAELRITGALGDNGLYTVNIRGFATNLSLALGQTLEALLLSQTIRDDNSEKTVSLGIPGTWSLANPDRCCLQFEYVSGGGGQFQAVCSEDLNGPGLDMYVDIAWTKAPPA